MVLVGITLNPKHLRASIRASLGLIRQFSGFRVSILVTAYRKSDLGLRALDGVRGRLRSSFRV